MKTIYVASAKERLVDVIRQNSNVNVTGVTDNKFDLLSLKKSTENIPDIIFATEGLQSNGVQTALIDILCSLKKSMPNTKIIYFSGCNLDMEDELSVSSLAQLVEYGIYNIYAHKSVSPSMINNAIERDMSYEDVEYLYKFREDTHTKEKQAEVNSFSDSRSNVIVVSSIKPGTGKSFVSTNIAADIARFGKVKNNGKAPNVVIIEGDLQTLSVGTLLGIENNTYNLKEALLQAGKIIDEEGRMVGTYKEQERFKTFLRKCCLPYKNQSNLYALVGSQLNFTELCNINPYQYYYMVEVIAEMFDVVIIDANSSLEHRTTGPILQLASQCYYVIDLDFNNIRSNLRYKQELANLGVSHKIKYILNKAITQEALSHFAEKLDYDEDNLNADGFEIVGRVPMIDTAVVLNRMYDKTPIVYDENYMTLLARMEFCQIASKIWPMSNITKLRIELDQLKESNEKNSKSKNKKKK